MSTHPLHNFDDLKLVAMKESQIKIVDKPLPTPWILDLGERGAYCELTQSQQVTQTFLCQKVVQLFT
jgi:hypothetical protein